MAKRPSAAVLAALLLISLSAAPASAATKPPSPQTQVKSQIARLSSDTRKLPSTLVKRKDRAALLLAAKRVARLSRRNPCGAIGRLKSYRRLLVKVRVPRKRGSGSGSARGRLQSDAFSVNVALLAQTGAPRRGGGAHPRPTRAPPLGRRRQRPRHRDRHHEHRHRERRAPRAPEGRPPRADVRLPAG